MRGFPTSFATKQDYLNALQLYPEQTRSALRALIADRFIWVQTGELADAEDGATDETHRVVSLPAEGTGGEGGTKFVQLEKAEDRNARLFRLGFTLEEAEKLAKD